MVGASGSGGDVLVDEGARGAAASVGDARGAGAHESVRDFDGLIAQVRAAMPADARVQDAVALEDLPFAVGPHAGRGIILKSRCAAELGGSLEGSCALTLSTADEALVGDGRVSVAGPDIAELEHGVVAPFAQIILVAGAELERACHQGIEECQSVKDWIEGYQVRGGAGEVWARVGEELYGRGLTFLQLGRALIELVKTTNDRARAVEVLFVTSSKADVERLAALREPWKRISHDLRRDAWIEKGVDIDCPSGGHCGSCADKAVCDRVRAIEHMRRAVRDGAGV